MAKGVLIAVRGSQELSVDVSELLRRPGATKHLQFRHVLEGLEVPMAKVTEGSALDFDLRVDSIVDGILVQGSVRGDLTISCRRCLRDVQTEVVAEVSDLYVQDEHDAADDDAYRIVDERIDLEPAIRDDVILALPLDPLCRAGCKGLCPTCGADRNEQDCGHVDQESDTRWEALRRLRESMEE